MTLHVWVPAAGSGPGIVLLQEIFGVGAYIRAVAERLCEAGYVVGAPDVFWRFAPGWERDADEAGMAESMQAVGQLDMRAAVADCTSAVTTLAALPEVSGTPGVLGFCLGGTLAWAVAAAGDPSCCVSYYGSGVPSMIDQMSAITCPTLLHYGNADRFIPFDGVEALAAALPGHPHVVVNVENAGHAFDNHTSELFWDESAAKPAWAKTLAFLDEHLPVGG